MIVRVRREEEREEKSWWYHLSAWIQLYLDLLTNWGRINSYFWNYFGLGFCPLQSRYLITVTQISHHSIVSAHLSSHPHFFLLLSSALIFPIMTCTFPSLTFTLSWPCLGWLLLLFMFKSFLFFKTQTKLPLFHEVLEKTLPTLIFSSSKPLNLNNSISCLWHLFKSNHRPSYDIASINLLYCRLGCQKCSCL